MSEACHTAYQVYVSRLDDIAFGEDHKTHILRDNKSMVALATKYI